MAGDMLASERRQIIIIGGGCIGICSAYFLTRHRMYDPKLHSITVLETGEIADGSSGKGGGLLASWATPKCLAPLSFNLRHDLAAKHDGSEIWGYRKVHAAEVSLFGRRPDRSVKLDEQEDKSPAPVALDWVLPGSVRTYNEIGTPSDSGQINPSAFTKTLAKLSQKESVCIKVQAPVLNINYESNGRIVKSVTYAGNGKSRSIDATDVVIAAGAWSPKLLPRLHLLAPKGHSIIVKPTGSLSPYILFPSIKPAPNEIFERLISPDIYTRPPDSIHDFDTVYASGPDDYDDVLPESTGSVIVEEDKLKDVFIAEISVSQEIQDGHIIAKQACFKPQVHKHEEDEEVGPIIGPVDGLSGLWLATGHDEWGIQNAPGTGLLISELILEGKASSANIEGLDPIRFLTPSAAS